MRRLETDQQAIKALQAEVASLQAKLGRIGSRPAGVLGYAEVTSGQSGITSVTDLTGLSVTVDVPAGRKVRVTGRGGVSQQTGAGVHRGRIQEGATVLQDWSWGDLPAGERTHAMGSVVVAPSSGSHTYKLTLDTSSGSTSLVAASDRPAFILVEDLGPA